MQGLLPRGSRIARSALPEVLVLGLAALVRFWRLDYHSFWFDELVSLKWASLPPAEIWDVSFHLVQEKHPPAYYLTLHAWRWLLGFAGLASNDAALRSLGALFGVLTVWGVLRLASQVSGRGVGLGAGLLTALSPALVWYSQELRMFQPTTTAVVWATAFLLEAWRRYWRLEIGDSEKRVGNDEASPNHPIPNHPISNTPIPNTQYPLLAWLGLILTLTYALYSYLFAAFFLPGLGLSLLWLARRRGRFHWRFFAEGTVALGVTTALFLPLARNAWLINRNESPPGVLFGDFLPNLWRQLRVFTVWRAPWPDWLLTGGLILLAGLLLVGLLVRRREEPDARPLVALWVGTVLLIANVLQATNSNLFKEDRYYLFLAPFVLWGIARGAAALGERWRPGGWGSGLLAAALLAASLPVLWTPGMFRENWRAAARYIIEYQHHSPGLPAGGVAHVDYMHPAIEWYLRQAYTPEELPVFGLFGGPVPPDQVETIIAPPLRGIETTLGAHTLWLVQSHLAGVDDQRLVQGWLDATYPLITEQFPAGVELRGYALRTRYDALPELAPDAVRPAQELPPGVEVAACEVITPQVAAQDVEMHPPSGWVHVRAWLRATAPLPADLRVQAQVRNEIGVWGESLQRERDVFAFAPPSTWQEDEFIRVEWDVNLNPQTPPGAYQVVLSVRGGDGNVGCGSVEVRG